MPLNIKNIATERAVRDLAAATGEGITTTVRRAAEERLQRVRRSGGARRLKNELLAIGAHCAALPDLDTRPAETILGYDENGLPVGVMDSFRCFRI